MIKDNWQVDQTTVQFDYEATIPLDAFVDHNLRSLEWSLLHAAVQAIGVFPSCDFEQQYEDRRNHRQLARLSYPTTIYSINRNPSDSTQGKRACCVQTLHRPSTLSLMLFVIGLNLDNCQSLHYDPSIETCLAIRAEMHVDFRGKETDSYEIQEYVKTIMQDLMQLDPSEPTSMLVSDVTALSYIGNADVASVQGSNQSTQGDEIGSDSTMLAAIISVSTIFLFGGFFLIMRARQRWSQDDVTTTAKASPPDLQDIETSSSDTLGKSLSDVTLENASSYDTQESNPTLLVDTSAEETTADFDDAANQVIPGATSHDSTEAGMVTAAGALPPRPPRRNSLQLKKKRRKKRKKKKVVLKRVNSRENINEMSMIQESEEEESENGSDSESYNTDEEGSGSNNSSAHPISAGIESFKSHVISTR
jgi:hypothetical protein